MTEENENENENENKTDEVDIEELLGNLLDKRGLTPERISALDSIGDLGSQIQELFKQAKKPATGNTPAKFDEEGFMAKVAVLIDEKHAAVNAPKKGAVAKWLGL